MIDAIHIIRTKTRRILNTTTTIIIKKNFPSKYNDA
jgi:hypothetical protein